MALSSGPATCTPVEGIGKALRACGVCTPTPAMGNWVIADQVDGSRAKPNGQVQTRWDNGTTPAKDSMGRHAHLRGIWFRGYVNLVVAGDTNDEVTAYQLRGLWQSIFLESVAAWQYLADVDGRTLSDDVYARHWQQIQLGHFQAGVQGLFLPQITSNGGLPANVGPGTYTIDFSVYFPLVTLGPGRSKFKGLIPLAAVQRWKNGGLKYRMGNSIPGAPQGVTLGDQQTNTPAFLQPTNPEQSGVELWTDLVYLPTVVVDSYWQVDSYPLNEFNATLANEDRRTEYAWIRHFPEDAEDGTSGQALAADYDGLTCLVAGFTIFAGENNLFVRDRGLAFAMTCRDSAINRDNAAQELPLVDASTGDALALIFIPYATREAAAAGDVAYRLNTHPDINEVRWLHRTDACHNAMRAAKTVRATKCGPCVSSTPVVGEDGMLLADGTAVIQPNEPMVLKLQKFAQ